MEEKDHPTTQQCIGPNCSSAHAKVSEEELWTSPPSTQQSRPNYSNYHWLEFIKDKIQGQDHMTCEVVQEAIHHCLLIAETEPHC